MRRTTLRRTGRVAVAGLAAGAALMLGGTQALASAVDEHGGARQHDGDITDEVRAAIQDSGAKNVILMIGDGMGESEMTIARNYHVGAAGRLPGLDELPLTGHYTTYAVDRETGQPDYVVDSAASGTAWATGTKTYNNAVSVDRHGNPQKTILQIARANGLKTGNVTTSEIQDATPAVLVSHISQRACYGPEQTAERCPEEAKENGGLGSISEQLLDNRPDVTLGGGLASFQQTARAGDWEGLTLLEQAEERGYQFVDDAASLAAVEQADQDAPLLGLFHDGNFPVRWEGPLATATGADEAPVRCTDNPERTADVPDLASLTSKAIELLDNEDGFFLQVEGASIDKQNHAANPCGQIGETIDLDEAVQEALAFAEQDGETLVIVTADHAHTSQITSAEQTTPGLTRNLITADDRVMTINYGTADEGASQQHTGAQIRIAAYGPGAANVVGLSDQSDTFFTMVDGLGLDVNAEVPGDPQAPGEDPSGDPTAPGEDPTEPGPGEGGAPDEEDPNAGGSGSGNGSLPRTGAQVGLILATALALLGGGYALVRQTRRRVEIG